MKIAQVTQHYLPIVGGQEVYIDNLNRVFRDAGWEAEVFQPSRSIQRSDVVNVRRIPKIGRLISGSEPYVFNFFLRLGHLRRLDTADIIISHYAFHAPPLRRLAKKTIILSHGVEWHLENMTWDDREHERRARAYFDEFPHVVNDTHYLRHLGFEAPPATGFFTEVAPGKWFIPNCVNTSVFTRTTGLPELTARPSILVPRQVCEDRGIHLAIEAFKNILYVHPEFTLHILGKIRPGEYIERCKELAKKLGVSKRVVFQDHISNGTMADYYSSTCLTLIPTIRREGTSLSALESMACGTPTVSTNVAGLRDLPTIQCNADADSVATAVVETLERREEIAAAQTAAVQRDFNIVNWGEAWRRVIQSVSSDGGNPLRRSCA
jgi:glycosyltransferase involved in cell wall biosynthesis